MRPAIAIAVKCENGFDPKQRDVKDGDGGGNGVGRNGRKGSRVCIRHHEWHGHMLYRDHLEERLGGCKITDGVHSSHRYGSWKAGPFFFFFPESSSEPDLDYARNGGAACIKRSVSRYPDLPRLPSCPTDMHMHLLIQSLGHCLQPALLCACTSIPSPTRSGSCTHTSLLCSIPSASSSARRGAERGEGGCVEGGKGTWCNATACCGSPKSGERA